jgi:hypothetical protein
MSEAPDLYASTLSQADQPVAGQTQAPQTAQAQKYPRSQESVHQDASYKLQFLPVRGRDLSWAACHPVRAYLQLVFLGCAEAGAF